MKFVFLFASLLAVSGCGEKMDRSPKVGVSFKSLAPTCSCACYRGDSPLCLRRPSGQCDNPFRTVTPDTTCAGMVGKSCEGYLNSTELKSGDYASCRELNLQQEAK